MPLAFLINMKNKNFKVYVQVFLIILISLILSGIHVVVGAFSEIAIHRASFVSDSSLIYAFQEAFREIFFGIQFTNPLFIFELLFL